MAVIYARCSTRSQGESGLGIDAQIDACRRWAEARRVNVVGVQRDVLSGTTVPGERPGLQAALSDVETQRAGLVLVLRRDRVGRDLLVAAAVDAVVQRVGARVRAVDGPERGDDPDSLLMTRLGDLLAEHERRRIAERTRAALAVRKAQGRRVGSIPLGWRLAPDGDTLEVDPAEQSAVARINELHVDGVSQRRIVVLLNEEGHRPRGRRWHRSAVIRVLQREASGSVR